MQTITKSELKDLLSHSLKKQYRVQDWDRMSESILERSVELLRLDHQVELLSNKAGELGSNYPAQMALLWAGPAAEGAPLEPGRLHRLAEVARMARCRGRFPVSVIVYRGQHICRSSTLSVGAEMYPRHVYRSIFGGGADAGSWPAPGADSPPEDADADAKLQLCDKVRHMDMKLLRLLRVRTIADLMVENKKVKFGLYVSSSEKVDRRERYSSFQLLQLPFPGCEFFRQYCLRGYQAAGLVFDWTQSHIDAEFALPESLQQRLHIQWSQYRNWDMIELTGNYLRLLLHCLHAESEATSGDGGGGGGLLIHCVSGWDRTPLFISLLRLTLWADGLVHASLDAAQILYLTLAYDWYLFGHNLPDRIAKDEEIMHFTFEFLAHICGDEFSAASCSGAAPAPSTELPRAPSDAHLVDGVLLETVETDGSSLHSSCSSAASDSTSAPPQPSAAAAAAAEAWPFTERRRSREASLSDLELSSSSSAGSGRRPERRRRRRQRPSNGNGIHATGNGVLPTSGGLVCPSEDGCSAVRGEAAARLHGDISGSLEQLPEQSAWPEPACAPAAAVVTVSVGSPELELRAPAAAVFTVPGASPELELRPPAAASTCRAEAGSFSSGSYREPAGGGEAAASAPVSVPGVRRSRNTSCASVGSWQMVGGSGSIHGSGSAHGSGSSGSVWSGSWHSRESGGPSVCAEFSESTTTLVDDSGDSSTASARQHPQTRRASRLSAVRTLFLQCYSASVGLRTGAAWQRSTVQQPGALSAIVSSLAGRVGELIT